MLPTKTDSMAMLPKCALNVAMLPGEGPKGVLTLVEWPLMLEHHRIIKHTLSIF